MKEAIQQCGAMILLFPMLGALMSGLFGRRIQERHGGRAIGLMASMSVLLSFGVSVAAFYAVSSSEERGIVSHLYTWLDAGYAKAEISLIFDPLSSVMILIVTGVGFLIHVYSTSYMEADPGFYRFFAYLNLFIFFMLVLVLSENLLLMFIGWEGVGLCSYLLISFWYEKKENAVAGSKAFIVNRAGDLGFLLGVMLLFWTLKSGLGQPEPAGPMQSIFSFSFLSEHSHLLQEAMFLGMPAATIISLCLFMGVAGKSAQIPLHVWLPDAMAGPTPVSALIHAATMVTAGVYLMARLHFVFSMSPLALEVIINIGALTALFGAAIGCVQHDIKKVLAYSTISQLGYMVMAMAAAAHAAGIFHLVTHAFFKACLFLGAGSVILAMHHEQDIRRMGGLKRFMPRTFITFLISAMAISGIPPLSGFFSKDEILWRVFSTGHVMPWLLGLLASGLTAFYMSRLVVMVFYGERRTASESDRAHSSPEIHEQPDPMTIPLMLLASMAAAAGLLNLPASLGGGEVLANFLSSVFGRTAVPPVHSAEEYLLMAGSILVSISGIAVGVFLYHVRPDLPAKLASRLRHVYGLVYNKFYIDEIYRSVFVSGLKGFTKIANLFDKYIVDLLVNLTAYILRAKAYLSGRFDAAVIDRAVGIVADTTMFAGGQAGRMQTGRVQAYVLLFVILMVAAVSYVLIA